MRFDPRTSSPTRILSFVTVALAAACASGGTGGGDGNAGNAISQEQVAEFTGEDAYDLVQRYRSRWLRRARNQNVTGSVTTGDVSPVGDGDALPGQEEYATVFLDGRRYGNLESLRRLHPSQIETIEYLDARSATTRYGTGYASGIIEVHSKAR
jgi:hypothetical protein